MAARIGIDTGGTFTDVVRWSPGGVTVHKLPSTPADPAAAVLDGLAAVRRNAGEEVDVVHGTTVGLNAVLTGDLARTAFVTNEGFEDLIEIGRQQRTELYALEPDRPMPPVPRTLRVGVACRAGPDGETEQALGDAAIRRTVATLRRLRPEAVAIGLLHSPAVPDDEQRLAAAIRAALPGVPVTTSSGLWPAFGEYERFSAAILNAAISPRVSRYLARLAGAIGPGSLRLMRSSLGILPADEAMAFPARAMFSGPAGGVLATAKVAAAARWPVAAAFDMGGTSTDVCLVQQGELLTDAAQIAGLPLPLPAVAVHTVGCGGGSIASADAGGSLQVGPDSAGADPGPACYGRGELPTVTDAHMALGHLGEHTLLGGAFPVDVGASVRAIERLARRLGLSARRCALGILEVAEVTMARALLVITVERAVDPATVPLIAYGGAGGLHAAGLARRLQMPTALVPAHPGAFSALGLALAGETCERIAPVRQSLDARSERDLRALAARLGREARDGLGAPCHRLRCEVVLRYSGQGGGLRLPLGRRSLRLEFLRAHTHRFGFAPADRPIEAVLVAVQAESAGRPLPRQSSADQPAPGRPTIRRAPLGGASIRVFSRSQLAVGSRIVGPCVIEEPTAVTRIPAGTVARIEPLGIAIEEHRRRRQSRKS